MSAVYVGSMTIGAAVPAAGAAATAGADGINAAFPDIAGRLTALAEQIAALATMPPLPSFADMLTQAVALQASIALAIATPGLPPPPSIATAIAALAALVTSLEAMTVALEVKLDAIVTFQGLLTTAGVHVVAFDGPIAQLGTEVSGALASPIPSGNAHALVLATTSGAAWSAMTQVFRVNP